MTTLLLITNNINNCVYNEEQFTCSVVVCPAEGGAALWITLTHREEMMTMSSAEEDDVSWTDY